MPERGVVLFQRAEALYAQGKIEETFEMYQRAIKKILKDEDVAALLPAIVPNDTPKETLGFLWRNFAGFFKDPAMKFATEERAPDAYRLLDSFRVSSKKEHKQFKSPRAKVLLKGMQIIASLTVGILAWDLKDRATAAKRYREALGLAATHAPFNGPPSSCTNLERWIATDVQATRENLAMLTRNDEMNANVIAADGSSAGNSRREEIAIRNTRVEGDGTVNVQDSVSVATDACKNCGKRGLGLRRCSRCTAVKYCGTECQNADWPTHKANCKRKKT